MRNRKDAPKGAASDSRRERIALAASLLVGIAMGTANHYWSLHAVEVSHPTGFTMDFAIGAYFFFILMMLQRNLLVGLLLNTILLGGMFLASLAKFEVMESTASVSDLMLLDDLFIHYAAIGGWSLKIAIGLTAAFVLTFLINLRLPSAKEMIACVPAMLYGGFILMKVTAPVAMAAGPLNLHSSYSWYPLAVVRGHWGAFLESGIAFAERRERFLQLKASIAPDTGFVGATLTAPQKRNVHIIVMESFIDPLSIPGATITPDPLSPMFQQWRADNGPHAVQPVFAGRSPDGLFEILCGLPAVLDESSLIFSQMSRDTIDCLPRKLAALGWKTESWVAVPPQEFTYDQAYERIGFQSRYFDRDVDMSDRDGETLSAQSALSQNLAHLKEALKSGQPLVNHIFVTAGHFPFLIDQSKRPFKVTVSPEADILTAYANCAYYTARAVESYVDEVRRLDPDGIIVVLGDHPPGLPGMTKAITYPRPMAIRYDVPLIIINGRQGVIDLHGHLPGYEIPGIVADLLTDGGFCRENRCQHLEPNAARPLQQGLLAIERDGDRVVDCATHGDSEICHRAQHTADSAKLALLGFLGWE